MADIKQLVAIGTSKIARSIGTGSVIGVFAYGTASTDCWSVWCPCVVYSKNRQRLHSLQNQGTPLPGGGERYDKQCCIYGALVFTGFCWAMQIRTRAEVRERYGIRGDSSEDCIISLCYRPLALTQERREIELEENSF
ncbi:PLAC8 family-domain-containing protein [Russula ochroleuca]|uniref:PLAC8 family-domain-containing protein n=1 Tax=Russula ochroleuca TaxID=152965 RepID=A0A9P5MQ97_9AGAM|nr:PLAC8 family-domain-containing protein [Russula ochroleuca]